MIRITLTDGTGHTMSFRTNKDLAGTFYGSDNKQFSCKQHASIDAFKRNARAIYRSMRNCKRCYEVK